MLLKSLMLGIIMLFAKSYIHSLFCPLKLTVDPEDPGIMGNINKQYHVMHSHRLHTSYQPLVPGEDDSVEHGFIEETVAHPLRYNNVDLLNRKLHLFHLAFEDGNH